MSPSQLMAFYDHVPINLLTGIANHVKSDTCNHANKVVSFELIQAVLFERYDQLCQLTNDTITISDTYIDTSLLPFNSLILVD